MDLKLNVYKNNKEIEKTYTATEYDLMWGTMEDLTTAIDLNKINDEVEVGKMVIKVLPQIKPLLKQIFPGLTDEEIRRTKVKELIPIFIDAFQYSLSELDLLGNKQGN